MTQEQSKMINIEKILHDNYNPWTVNQHDEPCYTIQIVKDIVREAIRQSLELAAENAKVEYRSYNINGKLINSEEAETEIKVGIYDYVGVNKQSIISVNELVK